jgi:hypothetical protein
MSVEEVLFFSLEFCNEEVSKERPETTPANPCYQVLF